MSERKYVVQLSNKRGNHPNITFENLSDRRLFLSLLNDAQMNVDIKLYEVKKQEEK